MKFIAPILFTLAAALVYSQPQHKGFLTEPIKFIPTETIILYKLGERTIPIRVWQYGDIRDIVCINLHDNENTAVQAAIAVLEEKGGTLIKIENDDERNIRFRFRGVFYTFDPNRIFSRTGIEQTLEENKRISPLAVQEVEKFGNRLLQLIPGDASCIIALHNNTEEAYSVRSYLPGNERQFDAKAVYMNPLQDVDDIAFTTDSVLYQQMAELGYNSIWQDNINANKDGSLSVYFGEKGRSYVNIETQHGRLKQYVEMLDKLLLSLGKKNKSTPKAVNKEVSREELQKPVDNGGCY